MRLYTRFLKIFLTDHKVRAENFQEIGFETVYDLLSSFNDTIKQEIHENTAVNATVINPLPYTILEISEQAVNLKYVPNSKFKSEDVHKLNELPDIVTIKFEDNSVIQVSKNNLINKIKYLQASAKHADNILQKTKSVFAKIIASVFTGTNAFKDKNEVLEATYVAHAALMEKSRIRQEVTDYNYAFGYIDGLLEAYNALYQINYENSKQDINQNSQNQNQTDTRKTLHLTKKIDELYRKLSEIRTKIRDRVALSIVDKVWRISEKVVNSNLQPDIKEAVLSLIYGFSSLVNLIFSIINAIFASVTGILQTVVRPIVLLVEVTVNTIIEAAKSGREGFRTLFEKLREAWARIVNIPAEILSKILGRQFKVYEKQNTNEAEQNKQESVNMEVDMFVYNINPAVLKIILVSLVGITAVILLMRLFKDLGYVNLANSLGTGVILAVAGILLLLMATRPDTQNISGVILFQPLPDIGFSLTSFFTVVAIVAGLIFALWLYRKYKNQPKSSS